MLRRHVFAIKAGPNVDGAQQIPGARRYHAVDRRRATDRSHGAVASFLGDVNRGAPEEADRSRQTRGRDRGDGRAGEDARLQAGAVLGRVERGRSYPSCERSIVHAA